MKEVMIFKRKTPVPKAVSEHQMKEMRELFDVPVIMIDGDDELKLVGIETNEFNYVDALELMSKGHAVKYVSDTRNGTKFCMIRGMVFSYYDSAPCCKGSMVYDKNFRYELCEEMVDTTKWVNC